MRSKTSFDTTVFHKRPLGLRLGVLTLATAGLLLGGCSSMGPQPVDFTGADSTQSSATTSSSYSLVKQQFEQCQHEGLVIDASAREQQSPAQYLVAAKTLDQCLVEVDPHRSAVPVQTRMHTHALTVLDYLKGGDVAQARVQLSAFTLSYPGQDLYFADYTSFVDSLHSILSLAEGATDNKAALNINPALRAELNRHRYWQRH